MGVDSVGDVLSLLDARRAMDHVRWLTDNTPRRISGTGDDSVAAEYLAEQMRAWGLDVDMQEFPAYCSTPGEASLRVVEPVRRDVRCVGCAHIASTPPDGLCAELVYVGAGGESDYDGRDVRGEVVLAEVSYSPATPEKARIAAANGAAGLILINWGEASCDAASMRALKAVWGNPTPETWRLIPQIPAVSVSRRTGEELISLCRAGAVKVVLRAGCDRFWTQLKQPVGVIRGIRWPEEFVLVSGHLDAWQPGVTCNATGNGVMLEIARVLAQRQHRLGRSVYFAFWNGHEIAEAAGSTWFVDRFWDLVRDGCVAYLNIDSPGLKGASRYQVSASPELAGFAVSVAEEVLSQPVVRKDLSKTGDQSFFGVGVPSITGRYAFTPEDLQATHGATLGWWNHTTEDTLDKVDEGALADELKVNTAWVVRLANDAVLPYEPLALIDDLGQRLKHYAGRGRLLGLEAVIQALAELRSDTEKLQAAADLARVDSSDVRARVINRGLLWLSRSLTSAFRTTVSPWEQDTYGTTALGDPVPLLADLDRLGNETDQGVRYLLETKLLRARNRLSDSVFYARALLRGVVETLNRQGGDCA